MRIIFAFLLIGWCATSAHGENVPIQIGQTALTIPVPKGFAPITSDMKNLDDALEMFVIPQNKRYVSFIPEEFVPAVKRGEIPVLDRTLSLQTSRKTIDPIVARADFESLKKYLREQNAELRKNVEDAMPGLYDKLSKNVSDKTGAELNLKPGSIIPFPPHEESDRSMAFSMLVRQSVKGPDGKPVAINGVVTSTFLYSKGKLFFIYVNGGADDLQWSRQFSREWSMAILAANPTDTATAHKETSAPSSQGFDWARVGRNALIGGAIGGLFGLFKALFGKKKSG